MTKLSTLPRRMPRSGRAKIGGEHDDEERRVAHRRHVGGDGGAQRRASRRRAAKAQASPMAEPMRGSTAGQRQAEQEPGQQPVGIAPDHAEMERVVHGARLAGLAQFAREADLRRRRRHAEPFLEGRAVGRELDAGHRLAQRGVDEVQPVGSPRFTAQE